jgi:hypothetical protein
VALRHVLAQRQSGGERGAGGQAAIVRDDGDVVSVVHPDGQRGLAIGIGHVELLMMMEGRSAGETSASTKNAGLPRSSRRLSYFLVAQL